MFWNDVTKSRPKFAALKRSSFSLVAAGLIALGFFGCGDSNAVKLTKAYPVKGKVLLADGTPLKAGQVSFVSTSAATEYTAPIGSDGSFEIKTSYGDGAPEGTYRVRIDAEGTGTPGKGKTSVKRGVANLPFPAKYADETTSDLKVTVKPEENNLEPFKLVPGSPSGDPKSATEKDLKKRG